MTSIIRQVYSIQPRSLGLCSILAIGAHGMHAQVFQMTKVAKALEALELQLGDRCPIDTSTELSAFTITSIFRKLEEYRSTLNDHVQMVADIAIAICI